MLFDSLVVYLQHTLDIVSWNIDWFQNLFEVEEMSSFFIAEHIKLPSMISFWNYISVQMFNECLIEKCCSISKDCSQKQVTLIFKHLMYAMKDMDWYMVYVPTRSNMKKIYQYQIHWPQGYIEWG